MDLAVRAYLTLFNDSVRSGRWDRFAQAFTDDAVVEFENVPVPAMRGREAIAAGYREAPPDDQITAVGHRSDGDVHEVTYRWNTPGTGGGRMKLTMRDGLVAHNVISLTQDTPLTTG
jgi:ketosteroid isomerase-like protein